VPRTREGYYYFTWFIHTNLPHYIPASSHYACQYCYKVSGKHTLNIVHWHGHPSMWRIKNYNIGLHVSL